MTDNPKLSSLLRGAGPAEVGGLGLGNIVTGLEGFKIGIVVEAGVEDEGFSTLTSIPFGNVRDRAGAASTLTSMLEVD